jgi:ABC-type nitrate/sulfonate/bicarbonate transport system ATPase subunit
MFVSVNQLDFSYANGKTVLRDISVSLDKGQTLAIVGASGCGKSTLLRILSGILPNNSNQTVRGNITINGVSPDEYRKLGKLAFMFQESTLMPNLSVGDNIAFPLKIKGFRDDQKVDELINAVGLSDFSGYLPSQLSGGMKTRVALARSFVTGPELLFLDEPFAALDIAWKSKLYRELEKLLEMHDTTVIFVTHDVQEALLLSDDVTVLSKEGDVRATYEIESEKSISQRVNDISGFMADVYANYMLPIQDAIMNENMISGSKNVATKRSDRQGRETVRLSK